MQNQGEICWTWAEKSPSPSFLSANVKGFSDVVVIWKLKTQPNIFVIFMIQISLSQKYVLANDSLVVDSKQRGKLPLRQPEGYQHSRPHHCQAILQRKVCIHELNQKIEPARTEATCWNLASEMEECPNTATPNTSVYLMTDFHVSLFRNLWYFGYLVFGIFVGFFCIFLGHFNTLGRRPLGWSSEGRWAHCHCLKHLRKTIIWKYSGKFPFKKRLIGVWVNSTHK